MYSRRVVPAFTALLVLSTLGTAAAIMLAYRDGISSLEVGCFAVAYLLPAFGVAIGYHRLFAHRAFETGPRVRTAFAVLAHLSVQGSVTNWVAWHRRHHAYSDQEGDVHSPHRYGPGFWSKLKGFWWSHVGWMLYVDDPEPERWVPDLLRDPVVQRVDRWIVLWMVLTFVVPALCGLLIGGTVDAGLKALLWGGPVRHFVMWNITWSINSVTHLFGQRPFVSRDRSGNVAWLALPSLGESWHNNHHAFPNTARNSLAWWQVDLSWYVLRGLRALGLVHDLREPTPAAQAVKRATQSRP
jgi:stearoyl-CoA desaturase (delta-9 desaturase)